LSLAGKAPVLAAGPGRGPFADGSTNIGDGGTTNYAKVVADAALTPHGTARVEKHITLDLSGLGKGATATRLHQRSLRYP
jgi:hypothetical protein